MVSLTEKAQKMVLKIASEEKCSPVLRAKIFGGGCAGFTYDLSFEEEKNISDLDEVFDDGAVKVVVDQMSYQYLEGTVIDYKDELLGGGFKFENPKSTGSCGCGNSVSF